MSKARTSRTNISKKDVNTSNMMTDLVVQNQQSIATSNKGIKFSFFYLSVNVLFVDPDFLYNSLI